ncbi:glutathione S-transferase [Rhodoferax bucti]|uniref:glutathione S-transferase n=1 Tax=Rhodoferax bucti TaxID=2576305 RepID=UPI0011093A20|nr:glutathione S-transferase [Rhodoferax bucti]
MTLPVLYSFRRCPYAMRARLAIASSGTACELREIVLRAKPPEMLQASPKGTVPVLVLHHDKVLEQSLDIMLWCLQRHDPAQWLPADDAARQHSLQLIADCDGEFKHHLDRYKYPNRYNLPDGDVHRAQCATFLIALESRLCEHPFLHGTHWGLADAAIAPFVRQCAHTDRAWFDAQAWPRLQAWLTAFEHSALLEACMHKYTPWQAGDTPVYFPTV